MKRIKSNYHALQVLRSAQPKLRKAIIVKENRELWVYFRERIRETNFKREGLIKEFAEFLRKVLPKDKTNQQRST